MIMNSFLPDFFEKREGGEGGWAGGGFINVKKIKKEENLK